MTLIGLGAFEKEQNQSTLRRNSRLAATLRIQTSFTVAIISYTIRLAYRSNH